MHLAFRDWIGAVNMIIRQPMKCLKWMALGLHSFNTAWPGFAAWPEKLTVPPDKNTLYTKTSTACALVGTDRKYILGNVVLKQSSPFHPLHVKVAWKLHSCRMWPNEGRLHQRVTDTLSSAKFKLEFLYHIVERQYCLREILSRPSEVLTREQMKLFVSEGNPHCLKTVAAVEVTGVKCDVQYVSHEGRTAWLTLKCSRLCGTLLTT